VSSRHILAGDIGGTRARFALYETTGKRLLHQDVLGSQGSASFEEVLARFLDGAKKKLRRAPAVRAASFGIAGPIVDQRVKTTNLPWIIDARAIERQFRISTVTLLNDLVAVGLGAIAAPPSKLEVIHLGRPKKTGANVAVIAAGTGLGEAAFVWDGAVHVACATEGSHVEFAPRTPTEIELLEKLTVEYGHVSYERVASGSTIHAVYDFFVRDKRVPESKDNASCVAKAKDANVAVVELAESGKSEAAMQALDLWASVYGAEAGNLALKCLASGGVYVCGGASARLASVLARGLPRRRARGGKSPFIEAFLDKGRMRRLLEQIPIAVCLEPLAGLHGAAAHAAKTAAKPVAEAKRAAKTKGVAKATSKSGRRL
jgi:glucokinase